MKATSKQTAIEWLMQQLPTIDKYDPYYQNLFNQAKEMEREQISKAYVFGSAYGIDMNNGLNPTNYYKETYESND